MPSVPIPIREAKEPVDSGRPYLKPSTKKKEEKEKPKSAKAERQRKSHAQREGTPREEQ